MRIPVSSLVIIFALISCDESFEPSAQNQIESNLSNAEALIDAFYSFDPIKLETTLSFAEGSIPNIVYYQGWAEGGNYKIVDRKPCESKDSNIVRCSITVQDDPMLALGIDFKVTDTFEITFTDGQIIAVATSSNDLQIYYDAENWVRKELPELVDEACEGYFDGGPTPGDCVRAMTEGYGLFALSDDFPSQ